MATVKRFEDLECWQEARRLVRLIYGFTRKGEFARDFELKPQIVRSSISVMANIAEGFHRKSNKDFMKFLDYSRSSVAETLSHCFVAYDLEYIDENEMQNVKQQCDLLWKKVNRFIAYLNQSNQ